MVTVSYKVYGRPGHRQALSFEPSFKWDWSHGDDVRILECECSDKTGTNEYVIVHVTRNTIEECRDEMSGQLSDGLFEDVGYGTVMYLKEEEK